MAKSEAFFMDPEFKFELDEKRHQPRNPRRKLKKKYLKTKKKSEKKTDQALRDFTKVRSCYVQLAFFSNSFISGESMVIKIELNLIFMAYYDEESFNLEKCQNVF